MANIPSTADIPSVTPTEDVPAAQIRVQANPLSFGGGTAEGLQALGQGGMQAGHVFGQVAADSAYNSYQDSVNKILRGDPSKMVTNPDGSQTPDTGFLGRKGEAAMRARPDVEKQMEELRNKTLGTLPSLDMQRDFDVAARRFQAVSSSQVGTHADTQQNAYFEKSYLDHGKGGLDQISSSPNDPDAVLHGRDQTRAAYVKLAQLKYGSSPEITSEAIRNADRDSVKTQALAIGATDPAKAARIVEANKDSLGKDYPVLADHFRVRADTQIGGQAADRAITSATTSTVYKTDGALPSPTQVHGAIVGQESGGQHVDKNGVVLTSTDGAVGIGQMQPDTFKRFALPGEKITNREDNLAASRRAIDYYYSKYGGDWSRVATAYFSGEGNVAPAGSPTPWVNDAKDGNGKSTSGYVNDVAGRLQVKSPLQARADAYDGILNDKTLTDDQKQHGIVALERKYRAAEVASMADTKARKDLEDRTADGYTQQLLSPNPPPDILEKIRTDPNIKDFRVREALDAAARKHMGSDVQAEAQTYGAGFWDAYKRILLPPGDPNRISEPADVLKRAGPGGDLTLAGAQHLNQTMGQITRSVNDHSVAQAQAGLMAYAKGKLSFEQDLGSLKLPDPKGEAIFNGAFIPKFLSAYDNWTKAGKNPWDFLKQDNVDSLIQGMRSQADMARDRLEATGEAAPNTEAPRTPLPPAPEGVEKGAWNGLMQQVPILPTGQPASHQQWAQALQILKDNPTPATMAAFNRWGVKAGYDAKEVLQKMGVAVPGGAAPAGTTGAPPPAAPTPAETPAAPAPAPTPAPTTAPPVGEAPEHRDDRQQRRAAIQEGLLAISEGREPRFVAPEPSAPVETAEQKAARERGIQTGRERARALVSNDPAKQSDEMIEHQRVESEKRAREDIALRMSELDKKQKEVEKLPASDIRRTSQLEIIAKQRDWLKEQMPK